MADVWKRRHSSSRLFRILTSLLSTEGISSQYDKPSGIFTKGEARQIEELASRLKALVGVKHLNLSISAVGDN